MLVAITDQNERFVICSSTPKAIYKKIREERTFFCPQCKQPVQFKIGSVKIPHFSHLSNNDCDLRFSEGESEAHLLGKQQLYELFQSLQLNVELESYLPFIKQRPDLLVKTSKDNTFAIEFQCSTISKEKYLYRSKGYLDNNIIPIWIPYTPEVKYFESGITKISLNEQLRQFIQTTKTQLFLITYHPYKKQFVYFSNLLHVKDNRYITRVQTLDLNQQLFPFYLPKKLTKLEFKQYFKTYVDTKKQFLKYRLHFSRKGVNDLFLRSLYELRLTLSSLPNFIGVPLRGNESMKGFAVEWQAALFYFMQLSGSVYGSIEKQDIFHFLKWAGIDQSDRTIATVHEYCNLIKKLSIHHVQDSVDDGQLIDVLYDQFLALNNGN